MSDFSTLDKSELYFSSKVIGQIRPSLDVGIPLPNLAHLLVFSEPQIELGCKILRDRFNLNQHQLDLLDFIQFILKLHRTDVDYLSMWQANGEPTGPLFVYVFIDNYEDQSSWEHFLINPYNVHEMDIREEDREHILKEIQSCSPDAMKVNYLYPQKTDEHGSKFLMEIWHVIPTQTTNALVQNFAQKFSTIFASFRAKPFDLKVHSDLVIDLISYNRSDLLRAAVESYSIEHSLEPKDLDWNQFIIRIWELIVKCEMNGFAKSVKNDDSTNETILMLFRMMDAPEAAEYRETYGPITKITKSIASDFLEELKNKDPDDSGDQYSIDLYHRLIEIIDERDDGGLHYMFMHEEWMDDHQTPFVCVVKVPEVKYITDNETLEVLRSTLGVYDPVSLDVKTRNEKTRIDEFVDIDEEKLIQVFQQFPQEEKAPHFDDLFAFLINSRRYSSAYQKSKELFHRFGSDKEPVLINIQMDAERLTGKLAIGAFTLERLKTMASSEDNATWAEHYLPRLMKLNKGQLLLLYTDDEMSRLYGFPFDIMYTQ
jgi:hypothetical protein